MDHYLLAHILVRGTQVDLSKETIRRFLFGLGYKSLMTINEFDYRMRIVKSRRKMRGYIPEELVELFNEIGGLID